MRVWHWMVCAACAFVAPTAFGQLHATDFIVRVHEGAIETGAVDSGGAVVYPYRIRSAVFGSEGFANFTNDPGVNSQPGALIPGMAIGFDLLAAAREWDDVAQDFDTISDDTVTIRDGGVTVATTPAADETVAGDVFGVADNDADAVFHSHVQFFLNYPSSTPIDGVWLVTWQLWTDASGVEATDPLYIVFAQGAGTAQLDAAVAWVEDHLIASACPCDVTADGVLNLDDVNVFAAGFISGDVGVDQNADGVLNLDDVNLFASCFVAGCP
ncbi:MAG: GC-type dockerin domain-anchored protein [Phycisphaerales bacterium]